MFVVNNNKIEFVNQSSTKIDDTILNSGKNIISIDIGAKNLAYCLLNVDASKNINIIKWDVLDICTSEDKHKCYVPNCKGIVKYTKKDNYYCIKHAKEYKSYLIIPKELKNIKKLKLSELQKHCTNFNIKYDNKFKKNDLSKSLEDFVESKCYNLIDKGNANVISLVDLGKNMKIKFDKELESIKIHTVLIENQISPIATRMKTLQGMVAQYFIMNDVVYVECVSSSNKLKDFNGKKTNYADRKKLGIEIVYNYLEKHKLINWLNIMKNHKKKDDFADSFLQALWYINNKL